MLAFPTPAVEKHTMLSHSPHITASSSGFDAAKVTDRRSDTYAVLPLSTEHKKEFIQIEFSESFMARTLQLNMGGGGGSSATFEVQVSEDGVHFRTIHSSTYRQQVSGGVLGDQFYSFDAVTSKLFRLVFRQAKGGHNDIRVIELNLLTAPRIDDFRSKADFVRNETVSDISTAKIDPATFLHGSQIVDISGHIEKNGHLEWQVPEGEWTILRIGHTPTGITNHPAPAEARGLECGKLNREAIRVHWNAMMAKLVQDQGPLAGKTFRHTFIDSYEVGSENWTPGFREEFFKRREYDLLKYPPTIAGWVVDSPEQSVRFLWDFRRTIADLYAENYVDYMAELAHADGLTLAIEPYGDGSFDNILTGRGADVPMTEFWVPKPAGNGLKLASSIANIYGKKIVGAESLAAQDRRPAGSNLLHRSSRLETRPLPMGSINSPSIVMLINPG